MKQFVKALDKQGLCFKYISEKFPHLSAEKVKGSVFIGPQIRMLINDELFITKMNDTEKNAWQSFKDVASNFLGNKKSPNYIPNDCGTNANQFPNTRLPNEC